MQVSAKPFNKKCSSINDEAKPQLPQKLNEKNLYLFDKQQEEQLFDKHQHWNKIFLAQYPRAATDSAGQKDGLFTS